MGKDSSAFREGLSIWTHKKTNLTLKWMIYGSVKSIGIDPKGWRIYPQNIWPVGGDGMAIILHCCASRWKYSDLSLNNSAQINRFWPKHCWFSILAHNFNQNYSQNAKFGSVRPIELVFLLIITCCKFTPKSTPQIAQVQFQKYKIFQLLRGAPLRHPCAQHRITPPPMAKTDLHPWLKCTCNFWSWGRIWGRIL